MKKAFLLLADGTLFEGQSIGMEGTSTGEIVFNTGMAGYQEVLTDPSYYGQTVCMTYPLQGNYGLNSQDYESTRAWVRGFIVRECSTQPSNWRSDKSLDTYLKEQNIVGLQGIDTRRLTRILRNSGVMNGILYTEGFEPDQVAIDAMKAYTVVQAVASVTCAQPHAGSELHPSFPAQCEPQPITYKVALFDFGVKYNIERELRARGCDVTVLPAHTAPETVLAGDYDGIMLSNGPGDPAENVEIIENLKALIASGTPIFGICLGHQLLSLAIGCQTAKMKFGHRGINHPVVDIDRGRTYITSQNHGYAVLAETVPEGARVTHINLNDKTVEGLELLGKPVFTVQYHPEVCPGPMDSGYLFDRFISNMQADKEAK